jgi:Flp pilus assembly protein TadD
MRTLYFALSAGFLVASSSVIAEKKDDAKSGKSNIAQQYVMAAQRMQANGDFQGALTFYERVLSSEPANAEAAYGAAETMLNLGLGLDSTKYFNRFVQLRPADPRGPLGLARAFNRANRPADALASLDAARKMVGNSLVSFQERGIALDLSGRNKEAQTTFAEGLKTSPKNIDLMRRMALSFAITEDYQTALSLLQNVANEPGGATRIRDSLAMVYAMSGQADVAMQIVETPENTANAKNRLAYFRALGSLTALQKAQAIHFGDVPSDLVNEQLAMIAMTKSAPKPLVETSQPVVRATPQIIDKPARSSRPLVIAMPQPDVTEPSVSLGAETTQPPVQPAAAASTSVRAAPLAAADRFWVQLAASPNRAKILQDWNKTAQNSNGGLAGYAPYLQSDMINFQPMLRLVVGGFFDASTAQAMIGRLKTLGVPAIMKRNALPADPLFP